MALTAAVTLLVRHSIGHRDIGQLNLLQHAACPKCALSGTVGAGVGADIFAVGSFFAM
jgi:hypothetical protein